MSLDALTKVEPVALSGDPPASLTWSKRAVKTALVAVFVSVVAVGVWLAYRPVPDMIQGMVDADDINVSAKITARVAKLAVKEGDRVAEGQVLFELDSPEVDAKQRQVAAALDAARALRSKATTGREEEIRAARANWQRAVSIAELAQSTFRRIDGLYQKGAVPLQRQEEAHTQALTAEETSKAARAQYDQVVAGARRQDQEALEAQVRQAEGAVAEVNAAHDETRGRAPKAAEVSKRLADIGELVPAAYPVFTLVDLDDLWVALNLRENQFNGVSIGRTLEGDVPALGLTHVKFSVYFISPAGDFATWRSTRQSSGYDVKTFEVRVRPVERIAGVRPGMSVLFLWPQR